MENGPSLLFVGGKVRADGRVHDDADRRINETVGRLLQIKNLAVLIGAGASMHLGSPHIRKLAADEIEELIRHVREAVPEDAHKLLGALVQGGVGDLEKILATLSAGIAYARATDSAELQVRGEGFAIDVLVEARKLCNQALAKGCELPKLAEVEEDHREDPFGAHRELFRRLLRARRGDLPRIRVFTTNYDLVIERTLDDAGVSYFDGFVGTVTRVFRPEVFEQDIYLPPRGNQRTMTRLPEVLYLYKLHGSINWRSVTSAAGLGAEVVAQGTGSSGDDDLALIFPTPQKEADVLGYPYSELFRAFGAVLGGPETGLLVLGYGFSDEHVNRFIFQALASMPTFQLFVVDPYAAETDRGQGSEIRYSDKVVGRLARLEDARVSVLTGPLGRFVEFATRVVPDPDELLEVEAQPNDLVERLSEVLEGGSDDAGE